MGETENLLSKANDEITNSEAVVNSVKNELILNMYDDYLVCPGFRHSLNALLIFLQHINETLMPQVRTATDQCQDRADRFGQVLGEYRRDYVQSNQAHANKLEQDAKRLQKSVLSIDVQHTVCLQFISRR